MEGAFKIVLIFSSLMSIHAKPYKRSPNQDSEISSQTMAVLDGLSLYLKCLTQCFTKAMELNIPEDTRSCSGDAELKQLQISVQFVNPTKEQLIQAVLCLSSGCELLIPAGNCPTNSEGNGSTEDGDQNIFPETISITPQCSEKSIIDDRDSENSDVSNDENQPKFSRTPCEGDESKFENNDDTDLVFGKDVDVITDVIDEAILDAEKAYNDDDIDLGEPFDELLTDDGNLGKDNDGTFEDDEDKPHLIRSSRYGNMTVPGTETHSELNSPISEKDLKIANGTYLRPADNSNDSADSNSMEGSELKFSHDLENQEILETDKISGLDGRNISNLDEKSVVEDFGKDFNEHSEEDENSGDDDFDEDGDSDESHNSDDDFDGDHNSDDDSHEDHNADDDSDEDHNSGDDFNEDDNSDDDSDDDHNSGDDFNGDHNSGDDFNDDDNSDDDSDEDNNSNKDSHTSEDSDLNYNGSIYGQSNKTYSQLDKNSDSLMTLSTGNITGNKYNEDGIAKNKSEGADQISIDQTPDDNTEDSNTVKNKDLRDSGITDNDQILSAAGDTTSNSENNHTIPDLSLSSSIAMENKGMNDSPKAISLIQGIFGGALLLGLQGESVSSAGLLEDNGTFIAKLTNNNGIDTISSSQPVSNNEFRLSLRDYNDGVSNFNTDSQLISNSGDNASSINSRLSSSGGASVFSTDSALNSSIGSLNANQVLSSNTDASFPNTNLGLSSHIGASSFSTNKELSSNISTSAFRTNLELSSNNGGSVFSPNSRLNNEANVFSTNFGLNLSNRAGGVLEMPGLNINGSDISRGHSGSTSNIGFNIGNYNSESSSDSSADAFSTNSQLSSSSGVNSFSSNSGLTDYNVPTIFNSNIGLSSNVHSINTGLYSNSELSLNSSTSLSNIFRTNSGINSNNASYLFSLLESARKGNLNDEVTSEGTKLVPDTSYNGSSDSFLTSEVNSDVSSDKFWSSSGNFSIIGKKVVIPGEIAFFIPQSTVVVVEEGAKLFQPETIDDITTSMD